VSPRGLPKRVHICWPPPREREGPEGAIRRIWLVGKQTAISNPNTLAPTSFLAEWSLHFVLFYRASPESCLPRRAGCLACLRYTDLTWSAELRLLRSIGNTTQGCFARKPFSLHELPSGIPTRGLTGLALERYIALDRGRSKCGGLTESYNGPLAVLSPEIVEHAVLTLCKARLTAHSLSAQWWSVSRPHHNVCSWIHTRFGDSQRSLKSEPFHFSRTCALPERGWS